MELSNKTVPLVLESHKPWASEEEKKLLSTRNKPTIMWAMELSGASRKNNTVVKGSGGIHGAGAEGTCLYPRVVFLSLYTQACFPKGLTKQLCNCWKNFLHNDFANLYVRVYSLIQTFHHQNFIIMETGCPQGLFPQEVSPPSSSLSPPGT